MYFSRRQIFITRSSEISENTFFTEHLQTTVSVKSKTDPGCLIEKVKYGAKVVKRSLPMGRFQNGKSNFSKK